MVTISDADRALKTFYLGIIADQLNIDVNPFLAKIKHTTADIWGKEIRKIVHLGSDWKELKLYLKNLYAQIEISDKTIRASQNSAGAFVNLLNAEMEDLLRTSKFNLNREFVGDGSGLLATVVDGNVFANNIMVDTTKNLMIGMCVDIYDGNEVVHSGAHITDIIPLTNLVTLASNIAPMRYKSGYKIYLHGAKDNELTGLGAIFGDSDILYGLSRKEHSFLNPYIKKNVKISNLLNEMDETIDILEGNFNSEIDMIITSYDLKRKLIDALTKANRSIDYIMLDGGYKAISYNGIPVVADRFVADNDMYILNSADFKLRQLCDWRWLEGEDGMVLRKSSTDDFYRATVVKYADLMCDRPMGQGKLIFK